ncbi:hypothetical protein D8666_19580 [Ochrobactrum soli]|uniref:hypothetical protein n=1 Tax=Ochrobactrum soli TaxID=2448455 RepID=UPI000EF1FF29|nr:hypothetical protein [[Ochrobactrum] soli]RLL71667.1 hypothetical protein D8666_19580 [[Ochrobactrum] soli]
MSARVYKRILIIMVAIVAIIVAYQNIPQIYIGERAQGGYEGGSASNEDVSKAVREAQEAAEKAGHVASQEGE